MKNKIDLQKDSAGIAAGNIGSAKNYEENVILGAKRGHGFAAEKANHMWDKLHGKDASIVGGNNAKNGADRLVDGVNIQTKYCKSGSKCVRECFDNNSFRYINQDGTLMQIEVPSDKYDDAVRAMSERIKKGQVPNVTDPEQAKKIIKKGAFTYKQAKNIAKFGTIESLTYDAVNGIKLAGCAMGISSAIHFAVSLWGGEKYDVALKNSCYTGLKVGGIAWISSIVSAQLGRTGLEQGLRGTTDWMVKNMGCKATALLANGLRNGNNIYGAAASNYLSKILRGNIVTGIATTTILSSVDLYRLFRGQISGAQTFKNITTTATSIAGGTGGWLGGVALGATFGTVVPGIGSAVGGIIGGIVGSLGGGIAANKLTHGTLNTFIKDDAEEMLEIVNKVFVDLASDYLLIESEANAVLEDFKKENIPDFLRQMYASKNKKDIVENWFIPRIETVVSKRKKIHLPTDLEIVSTLNTLIEEAGDCATNPA